MDIELNILQNWIQESDNIVFISGADLSAEAGFPDYRIMTQADWARYKYAPDEILRLTFLQRNPFYFYRYYREKILAPVLTAQPSPAHEALAHLEQAGKLRAILTVNIDGIHQEAGSREVLELHGSVMRSWCAKCEKFLDFFYIADSPTHIPYCNVDMCGDYVRPAIVLKEEPYDLALLEKALDYVRAADVLIIDTAGRLQNKKNLMNELGKINKILESEYPDAYRETLVVLDATTGQNALVQAREFSDVAKISGIVLTKMDGTAKGGIAVAIQSELSVPVKYIGVGETIDDLQKFDSDEFVNALFDTKTE